MSKKDLILRINLSSTPLANHTIFVISTICIIIISLFLTVTNFYETRDILVKKKEVNTVLLKINEDMQTNKQKISSLESNINHIKTKEFIEKCEFINTIVGKRIFSWTKLFNEFEQVLPYSVRMTQVSPDIEKDIILIRLEVVAQNLDAFLELLKKLETSKVFANVKFGHESPKENEMLFSLSMEYKSQMEQVLQEKKEKQEPQKAKAALKEDKDGKT